MDMVVIYAHKHTREVGIGNEREITLISPPQLQIWTNVKPESVNVRDSAADPANRSPKSGVKSETNAPRGSRYYGKNKRRKDYEQEL